MNKESNVFDTTRLEFFSDAVMAVIITIAVLDFKIPVGKDFHALMPLVPLFVTYIISFQTIGTYWNNHHHLLRSAKQVTTIIMWLNLILLFWLSLIPFSAGWLGENDNAGVPTLVFSIVLLCAAIAYHLLSNAIQSNEGKSSTVSQAAAGDLKGNISIALYAAAVLAAYFIPWLADTFIVLVSVLWFLPGIKLNKRSSR